MPAKLRTPNASPKTKTPTVNAVNGSMEPRMEVMVEPTNFTALTKAKLETTVDNKANSNKLSQDQELGIVWIPWVNRLRIKMTIAPDNKT